MSYHQLESNNEHIWQYTDLDQSTISICYIDRKQVENSSLLLSKIKEVEKETNCVITTHGLENKIGCVWIRIKNKSPDSRRIAFLLINAFTNHSCKEIVLPRQPDQTVENQKTRKPLTRSSTDHFISNLSRCSAPFSSILSPFTNEDEENKIETNDLNSLLTSRLNAKSQQNTINNKKEIRRYTIDFLLARSDVPSSKKMPQNWKELNLKYPNVCFCGKVISYFNPYKYNDHWTKTQNINPDLHNPVASRLNEWGSVSQTDDFINLKTRDFNVNSNRGFSVRKQQTQNYNSQSFRNRSSKIYD